MNLPLTVRPEAEAEMAEAYAWYEEHSPGLGDDFLLSVDATFHQISRSPLLYLHTYRSIRRALVRRFPYQVFFVGGEKQLVVLAVFHVRRKPRGWDGI